VLLLGGGSVCTRVRELLAQFRCTFAVFARTSGDIHTAGELDAALPKADIVCAALPDTEATRGLLDAARIQRFKRGALFVNVGRGSLVDEAALIAALREDRLRGAVVDVTQREPLPPADPLWGSPRTILTQHTSGASDREIPDTIAFFGQNLARYRAGEPLMNVIDWSKGY
jgi:phosphoglycerate dehydrogenase-like enzyme